MDILFLVLLFLFTPALIGVADEIDILVEKNRKNNEKLERGG